MNLQEMLILNKNKDLEDIMKNLDNINLTEATNLLIMIEQEEIFLNNLLHEGFKEMLQGLTNWYKKTKEEIEANEESKGPGFVKRNLSKLKQTYLAKLKEIRDEMKAAGKDISSTSSKFRSSVKAAWKATPTKVKVGVGVVGGAAAIYGGRKHYISKQIMPPDSYYKDKD